MHLNVRKSRNSSNKSVGAANVMGVSTGVSISFSLHGHHVRVLRISMEYSSITSHIFVISLVDGNCCHNENQ